MESFLTVTLVLAFLAMGLTALAAVFIISACLSLIFDRSKQQEGEEKSNDGSIEKNHRESQSSEEAP
jgi:hypothetical protein